MNTEKKNQHYVPKFYLKNFSFENNKKQIGVFNIPSEMFFQTAKLKTQASKNFYYGTDGVLEDRLSNSEGDLASIVKCIIDQQRLPIKNSKGHYELLFFVALMDLRNPVRIEGMKEAFSEMRRRLLEEDPHLDVAKFVPDPSHEELVGMHLASAKEMAVTILDLDYKLLINKTNSPFVTSDFPVIKYNQFLEQKRWPLAKVGFGIVGLQIFIPLNRELMLVLFDSGIYKIGDRKKNSLVLINAEDVDQLNVLSFLNCIDTIYFDDMANENYIKKIFNKSKKFKRANVVGSDMSFLFTGNHEKDNQLRDSGLKNLMRLKSTDCEIKLSIGGINIHAKGKKHTLNSSAAQIRPHVERLKYQ
jgi:hypothetical protein